MCGGPQIPEDNSAAIAAQAARDDRAAAEEERQRKEAAFSETLGLATTNARTQATHEASLRGLDPSQYDTLINDAINATRGTIPNLDPAPGTYFGDSWAAGVFDRERDARRTREIGAINQFAPTGFETNYIPNTADDEIINAILGEQYGQANQFITNARARGTLSDLGFNSATNDLTTQRSGAQADLTSIANDILGLGRSDLTHIADLGRQRAGELRLADTFDPTSIRTNIETAANEFLGGLEGRIRSAAPTTLFDAPGIIGRAGSAQGAQNLGNANLNNILASREQKRNQQRGLGTTGAF